MTAYLDLLKELEAIRARRHDRDYQAWLDQVAQIVRDAGMELEADLDRYDARKAREMSEAEHDALERARDMQVEAQTWERGE